MTDEEKAEEYIRTDGTNGEKVWKKIHKEFPNCIVVQSTKSKKRLSELFFEYTRVVFLDGFAEGKPKWHDLRKDPNDLPKEITFVIMYIIGNVYCNGWFNGNGWIIDNGNMKKIDCENVIAWCELPKFEELAE